MDGDDDKAELADLWVPDPDLSRACHRGLRTASTRPGQPARWLRSLRRRLEHAQPVADIELCAMICSVLEDLAYDEALAGRSGEAAYWTDVKQRVMARAWRRTFGPR